MCSCCRDGLWGSLEEGEEAGWPAIQPRQTVGNQIRQIRAAQQLGKQAICRALNGANLQPREVDALFFVSVTGLSSPSVDGRLINVLGLSPHLKRVPIFGLGCVAGAAGIARAADYVRAFPDQAAALVSVELCSLTWREDDLSIANLISTGLFGDGAAAECAFDLDGGLGVAAAGVVGAIDPRSGFVQPGHGAVRDGVPRPGRGAVRPWSLRGRARGLLMLITAS